MKVLIWCLCFIVGSNAYAQDSTLNRVKDTATNVFTKRIQNDSLLQKKATGSNVISRDTLPDIFIGKAPDSLSQNKITDSIIKPQDSAAVISVKKNVDSIIIQKDTLPDIFTKQIPDSLSQKKAGDSAIKARDTASETIAVKAIDSLHPKKLVDSAVIKKDTIPDIFSKQVFDSTHQKKRTDSVIVSKDSAFKQIKPLQQKVVDSVLTKNDSADNFSFHQLFKPYKKFEKSTNIETETDLSILQQNVSYKTKADFNTEYFLKDTIGRQFGFDVSVTKLNTEVETMGVQLQYDSEKKQDSTSTFAKPLFDIVGKHAQLIIDSNGVIIQTDTTTIGKKIRSVLASLSLSSGGDAAVGNSFSLIMNKRLDSLKIGDSWKDSAINGSNSRVNNYKVQNILRNNIIILITGSVQQTGSIQSDGHTFETKFSGTQTGKMKVDALSGLIKSKNIIFTMKGSVEFEGKEIPASAISKINEAVTMP